MNKLTFQNDMGKSKIAVRIPLKRHDSEAAKLATHCFQSFPMAADSYSEFLTCVIRIKFLLGYIYTFLSMRFKTERQMYSSYRS
jgi:hypothetical protein